MFDVMCAQYGARMMAIVVLEHVSERCRNLWSCETLRLVLLEHRTADHAASAIDNLRRHYEMLCNRLCHTLLGIRSSRSNECFRVSGSGV